MNRPAAALPPALLAALLCACHAAPPAPQAPAAPVSGIESQYFDDSVKPQDDFYRYVNGLWLKNTEIPADKPMYGAFVQLRDLSEQRLREIIEAAAAQSEKPAGSEAQKIGDFYTAFMDEAGAEALGAKPINADLERIEAVTDRKELPALLAQWYRDGLRVPLTLDIAQDAKHSDQYTVYIDQRGMLGLPDRDYYLQNDPKFREIRAAYQAHIQRTLALVGDPRPETHAKAVMALETRLARAQWTRVESRDSEKTYNKYALEKLEGLAPAFDLRVFLSESGVTSIPAVIVRQPSAVLGFSQALHSEPIDTVKAYLRWTLASSWSPFLSKAFVDADFDFYGKTLRGIQENRPRWKRAVAAEEEAIGEMLGKSYVAKYFPPEAKARMDALVQNLLKAYAQSIQNLDWMSEDTRKKALEKLAKFTPKIGYPPKWKDYSALTVSPADLVGNVRRAAQVNVARELAKLGKPIDRDEWQMTPQTVNAYYEPTMNEIVFPAAILQPPFFNLAADDAVNYGGIGAVIGHEIGHGFDDQGSKFDGDGNLKSWWSAADRKKFETRTKALIAQYDQYEPIKGYHVNGALTIGENIGDLGGLSIGYQAYQIALAGKPAPVLDGLTGDQRFFIGWAQIWRGKMREQTQIERLKSDPHSPLEYRCNGVLMNVPAFYEAFGIKEGDAMFNPPNKRVKIW